MVFAHMQMPHKIRETLRKQIIEMVLATDMKQHFAITSTFQVNITLILYDVFLYTGNFAVFISFSFNFATLFDVFSTWQPPLASRMH